MGCLCSKKVLVEDELPAARPVVLPAEYSDSEYSQSSSSPPASEKAWSPTGSLSSIKTAYAKRRWRRRSSDDAERVSGVHRSATNQQEASASGAAVEVTEAPLFSPGVPQEMREPKWIPNPFCSRPGSIANKASQMGWTGARGKSPKYRFETNSTDEDTPEAMGCSSVSGAAGLRSYFVPQGQVVPRIRIIGATCSEVVEPGEVDAQRHRRPQNRSFLRVGSGSEDYWG